MKSKENTIAMLLAGGQGSRLGVLTEKFAKPAIPFAGKYKIIDFSLSNCVNSEITTVGVLTQYQTLTLHNHIGIGKPWDLDRANGGVSILPPYGTTSGGNWYSGTADAIFQNIRYIDSYNPDQVLILSADHVYKMDYRKLLKVHCDRGADATIAVMEVPWNETSRFGIVVEKDGGEIRDFEEKPQHASSNLASMGIYVFDWKVLKKLLVELKDQENCDFGKHVIPYMHENGYKLHTYRFKEYWRDVGTLQAYWNANREMVQLLPVFNLYDENWKFYTNTQRNDPLYIGENGSIERSIIGKASDIYGSVYDSVVGSSVLIEEGAVVRDSIIMGECVIRKNAYIERSIIAERCEIGEGARLGEGEERPNELAPDIYYGGLVTIAEQSVIPPYVRIGKNTAIMGKTTYEDYQNRELRAGGSIIKAGEEL